MFWKLTFATVVIAGLAGAAYLSGVSKAQVRETIQYLEGSTRIGEHAATPVIMPSPPGPWDGFLSINPVEQEAVGLRTAEVNAQSEPIKLELNGRTAYDPDTLIKIRPRFDTSAEKIYASLGQTIKKGEKLVELHSNDLAAAKSDYQSKYVQWKHDANLLEVRRELVKSGAISKKEWVDTQNDEQKSRLDFILAGDKLHVYKVPEEEIKSLLRGLADKPIEALQFGTLADKAKMTLLSPADGIVIEREAVPGNFYETSAVLMVIAPLDHLWVWVNVYELDQDKVKIGQTMQIRFPFLEERISGTVEYVANEVSKDTRAVKVRAEIPNPGARLKSDMLVKAYLDIPPQKGQTWIPRISMVTTNGGEYVFVRVPGSTSAADEPGKPAVQKFERRKIHVAQETHDRVVVDSGLKPGEWVATNGSLILSQLYEDANTVETGLPLQ